MFLALNQVSGSLHTHTTRTPHSHTHSIGTCSYLCSHSLWHTVYSSEWACCCALISFLFLWIQFMPSCSNQSLLILFLLYYASWQMNSLICNVKKGTGINFSSSHWKYLCVYVCKELCLSFMFCFFYDILKNILQSKMSSLGSHLFSKYSSV